MARPGQTKTFRLGLCPQYAEFDPSTTPMHLQILGYDTQRDVILAAPS